MSSVNAKRRDAVRSKKTTANSFKDILEANVRNLRQVRSSCYTGYVEGVDSYNSFLNELSAFGVSFVVCSSHQRAGASASTSNPLSRGCRILFQSTTGLSIPVIGSPFILEKISHLHCKFGEHCKRKKMKPAANKLPYRKEKGSRIQGSKKKGCPAIIKVKQVKVFSDEKYSIPVTKLTTYERQTEYKKASAALRNDLEGDQGNMVTAQRFYMQIPDLKEHTHEIRMENDSAPAIHPELAKKIHELVIDGETTVKKVWIQLQQQVDSMIADGRVEASKSSREYYPTKNAVRCEIRLASRSLKYGKLNQLQLRRDVHRWKEEDPTSHFMYREYQLVQQSGNAAQASVPDVTKKNASPDEDNADCGSDYKHTFLFVHQNEWQRKLLNKYGHFCVLDAAYKVMKYTLPLYFLHVKTNVGYSIAGEFIVQFETSKCIIQALQIFQQWSPQWNPKFFMSDFSDAQMNAIKQVFPSVKRYLCDFTCEQAWTEWVRDGVNLTGKDGDTILDLLRKIANAPTQVAFNELVCSLMGSAMWRGNPMLRKYFYKTLLPTGQMWAKCFREKKFDCNLNMNNGEEALNKVLRNEFLNNHSNKSVSGLLNVVIKEYLPEVYKSYTEQNVHISTVDADYSDKVPAFLRNRPPHLIKHVMARMDEAQDFTPESFRITDGKKGVFQVKSATNSDTWCDVEFDTPLCSCADYLKWRYPCKHFCAVFKCVTDWGFQKLPYDYRRNPQLCIDNLTVTDQETEEEPERTAPNGGGNKNDVESLIDKMCILNDLAERCMDSEVLGDLENNLQVWISEVKASIQSQDGSSVACDAS